MMDDHPGSTRDRRWVRLARFALLNLVLWIVVGVVAGLLASQRINLGLEAFFRQGPATVIAIVKGNTPTPSGLEPTPARTSASEPVRSEPSITPSSAVPISEVVVEQSEPASGATPSPSQTVARTEPPATPIGYLLSWSDPPVERVLLMDDEMEHSAPGRDVQIGYTESGLNAEIPTFLSRFPNLPYKGVSVDLKPDKVIVRGRVTVLGVTVDVEVTGQVMVRDCRLWAEIETISIMDVPTPVLFQREIDRLLQEALAWHPPDYPLCLEEIWINEDGVSLKGHRR